MQTPSVTVHHVVDVGDARKLPAPLSETSKRAQEIISRAYGAKDATFENVRIVHQRGNHEVGLLLVRLKGKQVDVNVALMRQLAKLPHVYNVEVSSAAYLRQKGDYDTRECTGCLCVEMCATRVVETAAGTQVVKRGTHTNALRKIVVPFFQKEQVANAFKPAMVQAADVDIVTACLNTAYATLRFPQKPPECGFGGSTYEIVFTSHMPVSLNQLKRIQSSCAVDEQRNALPDDAIYIVLYNDRVSLTFCVSRVDLLQAATVTTRFVPGRHVEAPEQLMSPEFEATNTPAAHAESQSLRYVTRTATTAASNTYTTNTALARRFQDLRDTVLTKF